jgi:acetyl esterase/lipase
MDGSVRPPPSAPSVSEEFIGRASCRHRNLVHRAAGPLAVLAVTCLLLTGCSSAAPRAEPVVHGPGIRRGVVYRTVGGLRLRLDAYLPAPAVSRRRAVLVVHSGGWVFGNRQTLADEAQRLADDGFTAFAIDYRLAPRHRYPAAIDDVRAALQFVRARAHQYEIDPNRVGALGTSAGGHLVALLATRPHHDGLTAVVSWSGPMDLTATGQARTPKLRSYYAAFLGCAATRCAARARAASPVWNISRDPPPALLVNSTDELVSLGDLTELADALRRAHGTVATIVLPGGFHAEQYVSAVWPQTVEFFADHLRA